jgi:hypothetical protein
LAEPYESVAEVPELVEIKVAGAMAAGQYPSFSTGYVAAFFVDGVPSYLA